MKKTFLIISAFIVFLLSSVNADAELYKWPAHNLTFDAPVGGMVAYNTNNYCEILWDEMSMTISLFDKGDATDKTLKDNLNKMAANLNMYDLLLEKSKVKGFSGFQLSGTLPDGSRAYLCDLMSKKSDLVIQVEINYLLGNEEIVQETIHSFAEGGKAVKKPQIKQKIQKKPQADKNKDNKAKPDSEPKSDTGNRQTYDI